MSNKIFDLLPNVELLQMLARGSLKQNLPKAVRLWVILRSLYGDEADPVKVAVGKSFSYSEWSQQFFNQTDIYHKNYDIPIKHDPQCYCAKTLSEWLFDQYTGINKTEWQKSFLKLYPIQQYELDNLLFTGLISEEKKGDKQKRLPEGRLFAVTSKNLQYDFKALVEMGWLQSHHIKQGKRSKIYYSKVDMLPRLSTSEKESNFEGLKNAVRNVIENDLADFFEDFSREINGEQRFFLEIEYIVHRQLAPKVNIVREKLKEIWHQTPVPPLQIAYVSASNFQSHEDEGENYTIYPVCIYYSHRAPYLFAFGQTPRDKTKIDWYDYRIDRIKNLQELKWETVDIAGFSQEICQSKTPRTVKQLKEDAWGFDFYKEQKLLLVRFDRYFHSRYIEGTERDELFTKISYKSAERLLRNYQIDSQSNEQLLKVFKSRSSQDIYCRVNYRAGDNNVLMRLRAWGPNVEVFLPWELRLRIAKDLQETSKLYYS